MKNSEKILKDLINIYSQLYEHRQILSCGKLFKYDVNSVEKLTEYISTNPTSLNSNIKTSQKSKKSKSNFTGITTKEEFNFFYNENLLYERNDDKKREAIIKKYSKADFQEMFRILFGTETKGTKDDIFSDIDGQQEDVEPDAHTRLLSATGAVALAEPSAPPTRPAVPSALASVQGDATVAGCTDRARWVASRSRSRAVATPTARRKIAVITRATVACGETGLSRVAGRAMSSIPR